VEDRDAEAERLYYLAECARRAGDDEEMLDHIERLGRKHEYSPWRLKALISAANRFLLGNQTERYRELYEEAAKAFPETAEGAYAHWKAAWLRYMQRKGDAVERLRAQLERFPTYNASAATYFLGRLAERAGHWAEARAYYTKLVERFPSFYYGIVGRERLRHARLVTATPSPKIVEFLEGLAVFQKPQRDLSSTPHAATKVRIERARLLHAADLDDLAEAELRFGTRTDAQPVFMALESARLETSDHEALRAMKRLAPGYLSMELEQAPSEFWRRLFPLPFRAYLTANARKHDLDPFMVAALVRQESEFNPRARSRANALGLTQVMPSTGRSLARRVGLRRYSTSMLYHAEPNLRIGTYYLRTMLDQWGGKWEHTLASYNAGKSRVNEWITWGDFEEPAEFVETIPFTETRDYVQAVVRNAALYRQIYQDGLPRADKSVKVAAKAKATAKKASAPARGKRTSQATSRTKTRRAPRS
jgi:soluble lytic murein transglycosylase